MAENVLTSSFSFDVIVLKIAGNGNFEEWNTLVVTSYIL
jgi:hypothetical protein